MFPNRLALSLILASCALTGCRDGAPPGQEPGQDGGGGRRIEKTVRARVEVDHVERSMRTLRAEVTRQRGWIVSANVVRDDDAQDAAATLEARVPVRNLSGFRHAVAALGDLKSEDEQAEDVTAQVVDREARLRNARAEEQRLLAILERAANVQEVMAVEAQLAATRERIETMQAEADAQDERIEYALVTVDIGARPIAFWEQPGRSITRSAETGVKIVAFLAVGLASTIAALGPSVLIFAAFVVLFVWLVRTLSRWGAKRRRSVAAS